MWDPWGRGAAAGDWILGASGKRARAAGQWVSTYLRYPTIAAALIRGLAGQKRSPPLHSRATITSPHLETYPYAIFADGFLYIAGYTRLPASRARLSALRRLPSTLRTTSCVHGS